MISHTKLPTFATYSSSSIIEFLIIFFLTEDAIHLEITVRKPTTIIAKKSFHTNITKGLFSSSDNPVCAACCATCVACSFIFVFVYILKFSLILQKKVFKSKNKH
jgi:hypothetical protein